MVVKLESMKVVRSVGQLVEKLADWKEELLVDWMVARTVLQMVERLVELLVVLLADSMATKSAGQWGVKKVVCLVEQKAAHLVAMLADH